MSQGYTYCQYQQLTYCSTAASVDRPAHAMEKAEARREILTAIGLMSGTSMDGVDVALLRTDGCKDIEPGPWLSIPYSATDRASLRQAVEDAYHVEPSVIRQREKWPLSLTVAEEIVTQRHIEAVQEFLAEQGIRAEDVHVLGFHGQTLYHQPACGLTLQVGDGARLAKELQIDTVNDFRTKDVLAGGQGAPLAPLYHQALAQSDLAKSSQLLMNITEGKPLCILNIGGVANVTYFSAGEPLVAFDTGPGSALIDDWMKLCTDQAMDKDGQAAALGTANYAIVEQFLSHPWFTLQPPKSIDRLTFSGLLRSVEGASVEDGAATLTACTVGAVKAAGQHLNGKPHAWLVCGGGQHNKTLMTSLQHALPGATVLAAKDTQWPGDEMEAQVFAWLAVRTVNHLPTSLPETTGAPRPILGGVLHTYTSCL